MLSLSYRMNVESRQASAISTVDCWLASMDDLYIALHPGSPWLCRSASGVNRKNELDLNIHFPTLHREQSLQCPLRNHSAVYPGVQRSIFDIRLCWWVREPRRQVFHSAQLPMFWSTGHCIQIEIKERLLRIDELPSRWDAKYESHVGGSKIPVHLWSISQRQALTKNFNWRLDTCTGDCENLCAP